jgi:hypothetical protein
MRKKLVIIGAICVLLIAAFFGGVAVFILKARKVAATQVQNVPTPATQTESVAATSTATASFANLRESDIPGRYMIYGNEEYSMTLYADHTINRYGRVHPTYRWYLAPDALVINWGGNEHRYDRIEGPGIYSCPKSIGGRRRMEKQPADPSDLIKPAPRR